MTPRDTSATWTLDPDDLNARAVLDALAAAVEQTQGRVTQVTREEARWIAQLRRVAPDMPPFEWWRLARLYMIRMSQGESTADLDAFLAFAPWQGGARGDDEPWQRYFRAWFGGHIQRVPAFLLHTLQYGHPPDVDPELIAQADREAKQKNGAAESPNGGHRHGG